MDSNQDSIRLLILEDSEDDALLLVRHLSKTFKTVHYKICDDLNAFVSHLKSDDTDIIISDYRLNGFTGIDAFILYKSLNLDIPFIMVSGQIGEETAVEAMKLGVHDYLMKDRLGKLAQSIIKELDEVKKRKEQAVIKSALENERSKFHSLVEGAPIGLAIVSNDGRIEYMNEMAYTIYGYTIDECGTIPEYFSKVFTNKEDTKTVSRYWTEVFNPMEIFPDIEFPIIKSKDGSPKYVKIKTAPISDTTFVIMTEDITSQRISAISLEKSQKRLSQIFNTVNDIIIELSPEKHGYTVMAVNNSFAHISGIKAYDIINRDIREIFPNSPSITESIEQAKELQATVHCECKVTFPTGIRYWDMFIAPLFTENMDLYRIIITARDMTDRKRQESILRESEKKFRIISTIASDAIWEFDVETGKIEWNDGLTSLFGYEQESIEHTAEWLMSCIHPMDLNYVESSFSKTVKSKEEFWAIEFQFRCMDGSYKHVNCVAYIFYDQEMNPVRVVGALIDLTHRQQIEELRIQSLVEGAENERKMIAAELHDNLGQNLSLTGIMLEQIYQESQNEKVKKASVLVNKSINDLRSLAHSLMPKTIKDYGIKAAILLLLSNAEQTYTFHVNTHFNFENDRFSPKIETNLYRIVQEAITNIIKHANAKTVFVQMIKSAENLSLTIEDDGIGFEMSKTNARGGIGLKNIENRVYYLNGKLTIESKPGKGTLILVDIRI